jgi:hypothetical protein
MPRLVACPPRRRGGRSSVRDPFCDSSRNVSSASTMPFRDAGRSNLTQSRKRWRHRKAVLRCTPTRSAPLRTDSESSSTCEYASHLALSLSRASGVPLRSLNVRPQAQQRKRCRSLASHAGGSARCHSGDSNGQALWPERSAPPPDRGRPQDARHRALAGAAADSAMAAWQTSS